VYRCYLFREYEVRQVVRLNLDIVSIHRSLVFECHDCDGDKAVKERKEERVLESFDIMRREN
jgi:hypothetical protein